MLYNIKTTKKSHIHLIYRQIHAISKFQLYFRTVSKLFRNFTSLYRLTDRKLCHHGRAIYDHYAAPC